MLELKIPPPAVAAICMLAMWGLARLMPLLDWHLTLRVGIGSSFAIIGLSCMIAGGSAFQRANTTVNPLRPSAASALVSDGIYRYTRNPMYLGLALVLVGWAGFLASPPALLILPMFVAYITRFQILPEERVLAELFGADYAAYRARVRRWL